MISQLQLKPTSRISRGVIFYITFYFCAGFASAIAQEFRTVEFNAFNLRPGDFSELYFIDAKGQPSKIDFKKKSRTNKLTSKVNKENNLLHFYIPQTSKDQDTIHPPIISVRVDPNLQSPLLIFSDISKNDQLQYSAVAIEDSLRKFNIGSVKIVNLTGADIIGSIDGKILQLKNGSASDSYALKENGRADFTIAAKSERRHHLLYKNTLSLNHNTRSLLIMRPPKRSGSVKIQGQLLIEYLPDAETE